MSIVSWFKDIFKSTPKKKRFTIQDPQFPVIVYDVSLEEMKEMLEHKDTPGWWKEKYQQILDEDIKD